MNYYVAKKGKGYLQKKNPGTTQNRFGPVDSAKVFNTENLALATIRSLRKKGHSNLLIGEERVARTKRKTTKKRLFKKKTTRKKNSRKKATRKVARATYKVSPKKRSTSKRTRSESMSSINIYLDSK